LIATHSLFLDFLIVGSAGQARAPLHDGRLPIWIDPRAFVNASQQKVAFTCLAPPEQLLSSSLPPVYLSPTDSFSSLFLVYMRTCAAPRSLFLLSACHLHFDLSSPTISLVRAFTVCCGRSGRRFMVTVA
jgi:hypothetical protein